MLEKDIENLIAQHPDGFFPNEGFRLIAQQYTIEGRRVDILFEDKHHRKIIVEVKRGILSREASGQVVEYYGLLKSRNKDEIYEMILCANVIPKERRIFLENIGIECKEIGISFITEIAKKYDYVFIDERPSYRSKSKEISEISTDTRTKTDEISIWIFQANPRRYDILNALSDEEVGNTIHWLVNQHRKKIKKGHLALLWLSGKEAGIYAIARIETNPTFMKENPAEKRYWLGDPKEEAVRVRLTIIRKMINYPIMKKDLINLKGLENLSIFRYSQGTNFPVNDHEWNLISNLL